MHFHETAGRRYAQFDRLRSIAGLVHAFSTRPHDMSAGSAAVTPPARRTMAADWGLDPDHLHCCQQVHETGLIIVAADRPAGVLPQCDGAATAAPGVALMAFSADCPLVLVYDPARPAVGVAHASWRCTVAQIGPRLVDLMGAELGCRPENMLVGIGPGAGPCCYEVQADVYEAARDLPSRDRHFQRRNGRLYFDLWSANRAQLLAAGVPADHIEIAGICTMCRTDLFYSYRREGDASGHFALLAATTF